jgi:hypothetical protein
VFARHFKSALRLSPTHDMQKQKCISSCTVGSQNWFQQVMHSTEAKCIGGERECKNPHPLSSMHLFKLLPRCSTEPLPARNFMLRHCSPGLHRFEVLRAVKPPPPWCSTGHTAQSALHPPGLPSGTHTRTPVATTSPHAYLARSFIVAPAATPSAHR